MADKGSCRILASTASWSPSFGALSSSFQRLRSVTTPFDIGFSSRYLLDILNQLESDTTLFLLADPGSPTLIQDRDGASVLFVLMPMRV